MQPVMDGSSSFISCRCFWAWFRRCVSDFEYIWETTTCDRPFWLSCMKADLTFSEHPQLTIFTNKYGGDTFNDVPLLCILCALTMLFEISSLAVSDKSLDIWSINTDLVSNQELLLDCWYLMVLNIKVFLRDLFCRSSISIYNLVIVSNCLLILSLCSFISNFKLSISSLLLLALALASSAFFSICSILMYTSLAVVSNFSSIETSLLLNSSNFSLSSALNSSKLSLVLSRHN